MMHKGKTLTKNVVNFCMQGEKCGELRIRIGNGCGSGHNDEQDVEKYGK